ncbi:MAG: isoleucine--tRNA ligase [Calditrichaeota bacterium]|nr:isoleucine--tRNA ligase [Calditrichota bacterium]MCB9368715.1 isoleucine--tRNA ligase [Calditrichota bacterium]
MLKPESEKLHLPAVDHEILKLWEEQKVFERSINERAGGSDFVFFDGPPGTNGLPHIGHMMQSALKDLWPRYKTMQGYRVLRKAGWDTHGLPIELTADKELGFTSKLDVAKYGEQEYVDYCRSTVFRFKREWEIAIRRIGRFLDLEHAYATYEPYYIQSDWWTLKQAWNLELEGEARERALRLGQSPRYLYKDYRVMAYSPRTGTTLSNFEVAQGYQEVTDLTLYVKFKVVGEANLYLAAWTTTPWTLLSNLAVAVGPDIEYSIIEREASGKRVIIATARLEALKPMLGEYKVLGTKMGRELEGMRYEPLFDWLNLPGTRACSVVADEYVTTEDGTGLVHLANYGEDDFRILRKMEIPVVLTVDADGLVGQHAHPFAGREFREEGLDVDILKYLQAKGLLLGKEKYTHTYPFDYRTKTPLMYFPRPAWFIRATALKEMMLEANKHIGWKPDHVRDGRFGNWLENVQDWNVTRERYWGSPLPVWMTEDGSEAICVESLDELHELASAQGNPLSSGWDPHKPAIDQVVLKTKDGREMRRENFVLDSWFNAGLMPWGQFGFPAAEGSDELFMSQYPADFISEGQDQTRGWFYTLLACSCLVAKAKIQDAEQRKDETAKKFWSNPVNWSSYKNVICTELVLDSKGQKMSKSLGNVVDPMALFEKFGADPVRWIFFATNPWLSKRFGEEEIREAVRSVILPLWNSYSFFVTYAVIDGWTPSEKKVERTELDDWILSEYNRLISEVTTNLDQYDVGKASQAILSFLDELTNWYIRRSRRRFWKSESDGDKHAAYATLYEVLEGLVRLLAPFLPFVTEHIYQNLVRGLNANAADSVHLAKYPEADEKLRNRNLERQMARVQEAVSLARALREERKLKVRQPLAKMTWVVPEAGAEAELAPYVWLVLDEINVKEIEIRSDDAGLVTLSSKANFKVLGKKVGARMKEIAALIEQLSKEEIAALDSGNSITVGGVELSPEDVLIRREELEGYAVQSDGHMTIALDTHMSPELVAEGLAREVVHSIQSARKDAGFEITDRIAIELATEGEELKQAVRRFEEYICRETLCTELSIAHGSGDQKAGDHEFGVIVSRTVGTSKELTRA